jgi:hypothetical protein
MDRIGARVGLLFVCGGLVASLVGLHHAGAAPWLQIDWTDPIGWVSAASAEEAIVATLRIVGLAIGYWLAVGTAVYGLLQRTSPPRRRIARLLTIPAVRRLVDRALAVSLAASIAASPFAPALAAEAAAQQVAIVYEAGGDGIPVPHLISPPGGAPGDLPGDGRSSSVGAAPAPLVGSTPAIAPAATSYTVRAGDNLWRIAARQIRAVAGAEPTTTTIARYWERMIAANRETLRSGDPNLIYPGEIVTLPRLEASP